MTIGIDADGVLFDYVRTCANYVNYWLGKEASASYETAWKFDCLGAWGYPDMKHIVDIFFSQPGAVASMPVLMGAKEFISTVDNITNGDFVIVTACPAAWHSERELALEKHFGIPKERVHFGYDKSLLKLDALVDDYHMNLNNVDGWRILLDRPWNQNVEGVACQRVFGYDQAICEINRIVNWNK